MFAPVKNLSPSAGRPVPSAPLRSRPADVIPIDRGRATDPLLELLGPDPVRRESRLRRLTQLVADAMTLAEAEAPHPHRTELRSRRAPRRPGSVPARQQPCLAPLED
jgi:hypothetical protein